MGTGQSEHKPIAQDRGYLRSSLAGHNDTEIRVLVQFYED